MRFLPIKWMIFLLLSLTVGSVTSATVQAGGGEAYLVDLPKKSAPDTASEKNSKIYKWNHHDGAFFEVVIEGEAARTIYKAAVSANISIKTCKIMGYAQYFYLDFMTCSRHFDSAAEAGAGEDAGRYRCAIRLDDKGDKVPGPLTPEECYPPRPSIIGVSGGSAITLEDEGELELDDLLNGKDLGSLGIQDLHREALDIMIQL